MPGLCPELFIQIEVRRAQHASASGIFYFKKLILLISGNNKPNRKFNHFVFNGGSIICKSCEIS